MKMFYPMVQYLFILVCIYCLAPNGNCVRAGVIVIDNQTQQVEQKNESFSQCRLTMTYEEIKNVLEQHPCITVEDNVDNGSVRRVKRWGDSENKINALNGVINEHRTMINYLLNTSINATFLKDSITDHHEGTGPSLRSWRDLIDIICVLFILLCLSYLIIFRCGLSPCNNCLILLSRHCIPRVQQKKLNQQELQEQIKKQIELHQSQQKQQTMTKKHSLPRKKVMYPSTPSVVSDVLHANQGYVTD